MIKQSYLFTIIEARVTAESKIYTMEFTVKKEIYITINVSIAKRLFIISLMLDVISSFYYRYRNKTS